MTMKITTRLAGGTVRVSTNMGDHVPDAYGRTEGVLTSSADIVEAMKDPRYTANPTYRRSVELAIARSGVTRLEDADAGNGSYQVQPQSPRPVNERELTAHEAAMIAKAEKAGF